MAASIDRLGMSLMKMGASSESVRFLDEVDLTLSLDSRASESQQMSSIEISMRPIVFRASYRDINLITTIVNKALELYSKSVQSQSPNSEAKDVKLGTALARSANRASVSQPVGRVKVLTTKEQVSCTLECVNSVFLNQSLAQSHSRRLPPSVNRGSS